MVSALRKGEEGKEEDVRFRYFIFYFMALALAIDAFYHQTLRSRVLFCSSLNVAWPSYPVIAYLPYPLCGSKSGSEMLISPIAEVM
jgi:hypothetical protein